MHCAAMGSRFSVAASARKGRLISRHRRTQRTGHRTETRPTLISRVAAREMHRDRARGRRAHDCRDCAGACPGAAAQGLGRRRAPHPHGEFPMAVTADEFDVGAIGEARVGLQLRAEDPDPQSESGSSMTACGFPIDTSRNCTGPVLVASVSGIAPAEVRVPHLHMHQTVVGNPDVGSCGARQHEPVGGQASRRVPGRRRRFGSRFRSSPPGSVRIPDRHPRPSAPKLISSTPSHRCRRPHRTARSPARGSSRTEVGRARRRCGGFPCPAISQSAYRQVLHTSSDADPSQISSRTPRAPTAGRHRGR